MSTDLTRIEDKARKEPNLVFTSLYHHVTDMDNLQACYEALEADKAVGVDGVTKEEYGRNLEENLQDLSNRLKRMDYRPQPKRLSVYEDRYSMASEEFFDKFCKGQMEDTKDFIEWANDYQHYMGVI